jgi:methionyl-tRNA formyltransferase
MPADIGPVEMKRRIRAFRDDFRGIPLTVTLNGMRFQLAGVSSPQPVAAAVPAETIEAPPLALAS